MYGSRRFAKVCPTSPGRRGACVVGIALALVTGLTGLLTSAGCTREEGANSVQAPTLPPGGAPALPATTSDPPQLSKGAIDASGKPHLLPPPTDAEPAAAASPKSTKPLRPGAIDGRVVYNGEGAPLGLALGPKNGVPGARVALRQGAVELSTAETDERGKFRFRDVAEGVYQVRVERDGLTSVEEEVDVEAGAISVLALGFHSPSTPGATPADAGSNRPASPAVEH